MNKICTSTEQSQKIIELGIDVTTSDMFWLTTDKPRLHVLVEDLEKYSRWDCMPAWSLSALLGLMPKLYELENDPDDAGCQPNLCKGWDNNLWHIVYRSTIYITEWYDDPVDAAFEMVCWMLENGKL